MNWVLMTTVAVIVIGFFIGVYRGAVRIAVSLLTTMITLILVTLLTPYVSKAISEFTPLDEVIEDQVKDAVIQAAGSAAADVEEGALTEEGVRKVLKAAGMNEEQLNELGISIDDIIDGKVTGEELSKYGISSSILDGLKAGSVQEAIEEAEVPRDMQVAAIESAKLPEVFKNLLSTNNNDEIYKELGVETFAQYVGQFLAKLVINVVSFLCTFLVVTIITRAVIFALDFVADLPMLGIVNRIAGGAIGIVCALVIVWTLFIIVTLMYVASFGTGIYDTIQDNGMLKMLYEYNPVMQLATKM